MAKEHVPFDLTRKRIWVAGHTGMVGGAVVRRLAREPCEVLTASRADLDLRRQDAVEAWMARNRPDAVVLAAAKVGGIWANDNFPADFLLDNLAIQLNVMKAASDAGVSKLLFLGSSCIYPRDTSQPIKESSLLTGPLEQTNEWYAVAKIAGIKMCQALRHQHSRDFISAMPSNLYGPGDNYDARSSHVIAALIRRVHEAKLASAPEIIVWGTGTPRREFLYVEDLADALVFLLRSYSEAEHINVGSGSDLTIRELAETICSVVGYSGKLVFDRSMPDGTPRKLMDGSRLAGLGWKPRVSLTEGLATAYADFVARGYRKTVALES